MFIKINSALFYLTVKAAYRIRAKLLSMADTALGTEVG